MERSLNAFQLFQDFDKFLFLLGGHILIHIHSTIPSSSQINRSSQRGSMWQYGAGGGNNKSRIDSIIFPTVSQKRNVMTIIGGVKKIISSNAKKKFTVFPPHLDAYD